MLERAAGESLEAYLADKVFAGLQSATVAPDERDVVGFGAFMERYKQGLVIERAAVDALK